MTFKSFLNTFIVVFVDDILIYFKISNEHAENLQMVLKTLEEHKLYTMLKKYEFLLENVHFLGHIVSHGGISVEPPKPSSIG